MKKTLEPSAVIPSKRTPCVVPGGEIDRFARVADVHVEVPVLGVAFF